MSEPESLNFEPSSSRGGSVQNTGQVLRQLQPQPLEINRDDLFFRAGFAAGRRGGAARYSWPSAAAALLLVSIGLGVVVMRQASVINSQPIVSATASEARVDNAASITTGPQHPEQDPYFARQQRNWQRLASASPLPPGRLTATGWEELPPDAVKADSALESTLQDSPADRSKSDATPLRPATYLELMRLQREG